MSLSSQFTNRQKLLNKFRKMTNQIGKALIVGKVLQILIKVIS